MRLSDSQKKHYEKFVIDYRPTMLKTAKKFGCNDEDAEDIVQEVLVKLVEKFSDPNFDEPKSWLYVVVKHQVFDYFRKKRKIKYYGSPEDFETQSDSPLENLDLCEGKEIQEIVHDEMSKLTDTNRTALEFHLMGYSGEEASKKLGIKYMAYQMRVYRAKKKMQNSLKERLDME